MRILITGCTYFPSRNGQSIFTINLAEGLAARGNKVLVVIPALGGHAREYERNGVQIRELDSLDLGKLHSEAVMSFFPGKQVRAILDEFMPDLIHVHDHFPLSTVMVREAKKRKIKVVGTNHFVPDNLSPYVPGSAHFFKILSRIMWKWMRLTFDQLDFATAPSRTAAEILRQQNIKLPIYPISCGVDINRFKPIPYIDRTLWLKKYGLDSGKPVVLFVGRVDAEKKLDLLIRALHHRNKNDLVLAIAGNGSFRKNLEQMVEQFGLAEQVKFLGFVPNEDLPSIINAIDIFTMPSEAELLSIASLEAMACAKPILLANARALPELVHNGVNGYLFNPGSVEDLSAKIDLLLSQSDKWPDMGKESLRMSQAHTLENTITGYSMLYYTLVAEKKLPNPQTEWLNMRPGASTFTKISSAN
jgi:glycosyltransferase involved in cell wall biosynthesis